MSSGDVELQQVYVAEFSIQYEVKAKACTVIVRGEKTTLPGTFDDFRQAEQAAVRFAHTKGYLDVLQD